MIVFLSTADTDLLAVERARAATPGLPPLFAGNPVAASTVDAALQALDRHVAASGPAAVVLRLLGGRRAHEGLADRLSTACRAARAPLIALSGDAADDVELSALSTAPARLVDLVSDYLRYGGPTNAAAALRSLSDAFCGTSLGAPPPTPQPEHGICHPDLEGEALTLDEFAARRSWSPSRPRVGLLFYRAHWLSGNTAFVDALVRAIEDAGCDAVAVFCPSLRPPNGPAGEGNEYVLERYFLDEDGTPLVDVLISTLSFAASTLSSGEELGLPAATEAAGPAGTWFRRLGVPVLQALVCTETRAAWEASAAGLRPVDVGMQVALPEFDGRIVTVPVSFKEVTPVHGDGGALVPQYVADVERCAALAAQAASWARLRRTPNGEKRIAIVLGNYPARNGRVGNAVGLDTPASLVALLQTLRGAGYDLGDPRDLPDDADALIHRLIAAGTYDPDFPGANLNDTWRRAGACPLPSDRPAAHKGLPYAGLADQPGKEAPPGLRLGNVFVGIQPPRGWGDDPDAVYHDPELPPPAPYVRFYRWLRAAPSDGWPDGWPVGWGAHALVHLGKHGTLEWLPGKAVGLSKDCAPDALLVALPLIYPFIVNDPGEGTQAKRRAHAVIVDHLVPPLAEAGLHGDLAALERLIQEERGARTADPGKLPILRQQIWQAVRNASLDDDLGLVVDEPDAGGAPARGVGQGLVPCRTIARHPTRGRPTTLVPIAVEEGPQEEEAPDDAAFDHLLDRLEAYLHDLERATIRDGLHVLGQAPVGEQRQALLDAMLRLAPQGVGAEVRRRLDGLLDRTSDELAAILAALDGGFVAPGPSGSPTRGMWNVLPTGRNFYSVDPQAIPSPAAWETGRRLADTLLDRYLGETGEYPRTVGLVLWGTAAMRTHGDDVAQALALLGVRPIWQPETGRVRDLEPIPLAELGRARVDVTLHVSGFFRDAFPHLLALLDRAVELVAGLDESAEENFVAAHVRQEAAALAAAGTAPEAARRRASYRVFGAKPGCYGAGLLPLIESRNWQTTADLARAYETWSAYAYGRDAAGISDREQFRARFGAIDVATKNQDNREHDLFDSDDYFQYHGGMVAAARSLRNGGPPPRAYFGDSADPRSPQVRDLNEEARRVFRSRVTNPRWLAAMRRHGYKGAFEMAATVDYLFGYDATAGVAADWMYERLAHAYVLDRGQQAFFQRSNPWALRDVAERLLEAAGRGLWEHPDRQTLEEVRRVYLEADGDLEAGEPLAEKVAAHV